MEDLILTAERYCEEFYVYSRVSWAYFLLSVACWILVFYGAYHSSVNEPGFALVALVEVVAILLGYKAAREKAREYSDAHRVPLETIYRYIEERKTKWLVSDVKVHGGDAKSYHDYVMAMIARYKERMARGDEGYNYKDSHRKEGAELEGATAIGWRALRALR